MKALVLDHYDSFTYNLVRYLNELNIHTTTAQYDQVSIDKINALSPNFLLISPGPRHPQNINNTINIIQHYKDKLPIIGICLGHQAIAYAFGGKIERAQHILHGKCSLVSHDGDLLFNQIPKTFEVTRYHSLLVSNTTLPSCLKTIALANREIMALKHRELPIYGLQYHPEAHLTQFGHQVLQNFIKVACPDKFLSENKLISS